ncbi:MAG TPA: EAL domain-containing protein [Gammaproteobacteria bacterium]
MSQFTFRRKVLLLAVTLVTAVQIVTLFPVLDAIEQDATERAERTTRLAGLVFEEFMSNRTDQLLTTANVLVSDFGFKQAVASQDEATIRSALRNHAARARASVALLLGLDGAVHASSVDGALPQTVQLPLGVTPDRSSSAVVEIGGTEYQTVTVPVRAPITVAWVMLGYPIDESLALHVKSLTGLEVSVLRLRPDAPEIVASTLPRAVRATALHGIDPADAYALERVGADSTGGFLTGLRPFLAGSKELYVALQLSLAEAMASYRSIRAILLGVAGFSLALAVAGAFWLANTVTRPVEKLAAAARRMREGIYTEPIEIRSADELGELAGSFNAMQHAIADREQRIVHQAHHDSLTGLPNRELAIARLCDALEHTNVLSVVSLTLDRFNNIVSSLGHRAGDEVIVLVAGLLRNRMQEGQTLGHLGGDEFVLTLPQHDGEQATEWALGLLDQLRSGVRVAGANVSLRGVVGISVHPHHGSDAAELVRRASIARAEARRRSEPVVVYKLGQEDRFLRQLRIVGDFPKAVKANELELHFQPQIDCVTRRARSVEALVRWRHPELGLLTPDSFVDAIEQAGGISHLTRWVLREAVRCLREWRKHGADLSLAVNISVDDLSDDYLPYYLLDLVRQSGLPPSDVTLELTESAIMHNVSQSRAVVACIRELGFRIAVDDFGIGQSALAQLKRLPVDELKIDKSFVLNLGDSRDEAIVRSTIELAHRLRMGVVAEGVETAEALERLRELGCESAQGYHIARPLPASDVLLWLEDWRRRGRCVVPFTGPRRRGTEPAPA